MTPAEQEPTPDDIARHERERLHVLEALELFAGDPRAILDVVLEAEDAAAAHEALRAAHGLDEVQADALIDVQFRRATKRDRARISEACQEIRAHLAAG